MSSISPTAALARFVVDTAWDDVPAPVVHEAKRATLNWLGCAIGGSSDPAVERLVEALGGSGGAARVGLIGRDQQLDLFTAACVNGMASNVLDFDDTHLPSMVHPTVPVAAAAFSMAQQLDARGQDFLLALIIGIDIECRVGAALASRLFGRGWHPTAVCGVIGAAAACARLLNLDSGQAAHALSLAATQASGLTAMFGSMGKSYNMGHAARNGLTAAVLASQGFTGHPQVFDGPGGFLDVFGALHEADGLADGLGAAWQLLDNAYKPYPCGIVMHAAIDACLDLSDDVLFNAADIDTVHVTVDAVTYNVGARPLPRTPLEAKLNLPYIVAAALADREVGVDQFSATRLEDPALVDLCGRVVLHVDDHAPGQARVRLVLRGGAEHQAHVVHARGSTQRPLTDAELDAKFRRLAGWARMDDVAIERVLTVCHNLDAVSFNELGTTVCRTWSQQ